jgi:hypothetical protein
MSDQLVLALTAACIINFALLCYIWMDGRRCVYPGRTDVQAAANGRLEGELRLTEHSKEMLLIDIRRREQLLDIRLKRLERRPSIR